MDYFKGQCVSCIKDCKSDDITLFFKNKWYRIYEVKVNSLYVMSDKESGIKGLNYTLPFFINLPLVYNVSMTRLFSDYFINEQDLRESKLNLIL